MLQLIKRLYEIAGDQKNRITKMLISEVLKAIFEGVALGGVMLVLLKISEVIFQNKVVKKSDVILVFIIMLISVVGKIISGYIADRNKNIASYKMGAENRLYIGNRLKQVNMGYFSSNRLGNVTGGLTTVIGELETTGIYIIEIMLVGIIQTIIMAIFMLPFDPITGVIILSVLMFGMICNQTFQNKSDSLTRKLLGLKLDLNSATLEYVQGIGVVKAFGKSNQALKNINKSIEENRKGYLDVEKALVPSQLLYMSVFKLGTCIIIFITLLRYCGGRLDIQKTMMLLIASFIVFGGFEMAGTMQAVRGIAMQNLDTIFKLRNMPILKQGNEKEFRDSNVLVEHAKFAYDKEDVINDVSCVIPEGKVTAIVGPSGSGKSTLCHLIARFWDVDKGDIKISNKNVKEFDYDSLLSNITMVFQDVYLFEDTVTNNIKFGKPEASDEEVVEIAKKACCHDFIMKLPQGYDTVLNEGGLSLSGGERQRLSIARAMLKKSNLVILDEATSSIDPENEESLMKALKELLKGKTAIIIAHRISTIREADNIIVMDKGKIVDQGVHNDLVQKNGIYHDFVKIRSEAISWEL
ncbi:ABC transporter ATP-binding protein [Clostridium niameyense]|uniref:ABC transporter ATP-binding protein n=1 Tax=Clostridium niameyense TaxID=1622073 RepID=A0A6M0RAM5_9CLOT|nr:ABC transporter ATP-binding protein [Clostridium niameyense]NEZ47272.1 ABC transporter ATP-binding protein [Clostridium niameyense]